MRRLDFAAGLVFAADAATAAAAGFNCLWMFVYWLGGAGRRLPAATLAIVNAGIAVQAGFAQALFAAHRFDLSTGPLFSPAAWLASRVVLLAGTLLISMLILRTASR
jgi:hypothetical protein